MSRASRQHRLSRHDRGATRFFYTAIGGTVAVTIVGPFSWTPLNSGDWPLLLAYCAVGLFSHYCFIRAYQVLQASEVQPLTYLQLVFGAVIAIVFFNEVITWHLIVGAMIVVGAGLFTMFREHLLKTGKKQGR